MKRFNKQHIMAEIKEIKLIIRELEHEHKHILTCDNNIDMSYLNNLRIDIKNYTNLLNLYKWILVNEKVIECKYL